MKKKTNSKHKNRLHKRGKWTKKEPPAVPTEAFIICDLRVGDGVIWDEFWNDVAERNGWGPGPHIVDLYHRGKLWLYQHVVK